MNPLKPTVKSESLFIFILLVSWALAIFFYGRLDFIPTHWSWEGQVDAWSSSAWAFFLFPLLLSGVYALFTLLPFIDPRRENYSSFGRVYFLFKGLLVGFFFLIQAFSVCSGFEIIKTNSLFIPSLISFLMITIGFLLPELKTNWFIGIRTPWTLSSEESWRKTHLFGRKVFIMMGVVLFLSVFLPIQIGQIFFISTILFGVLIIFIYSYIIYKNDKNRQSAESSLKESSKTAQE